MDNDFGLDVELFPKELTLLLSLMRMEQGKGVPSNNKEWLNDIDWGLFLQLARHHRIYPVLYTNIKKVDGAGIPLHVIQTLHKEYQSNIFQMLYISAEMEHICKQFSEHHIRTLLLKGPVLAADLYGELALRTCGDLDILTPINDLDRAEELLEKLGYVKDDYIETILDDWKWRHHHITFFHPHKRIKLEIHWRLSPGPGKEPSFNELWERRRISTLTGHPVYFLGSEDLFLFLVTHGARHGWSRLRWLTDIDQITQKRLDWNKINMLLHEYQYLHLGGQALILASRLLHTPISKEMEALTAVKRSNRLAQDALFYIKQMVNLHTDPVPEDVAKYHKRHLFALMSKQQKFLFIASFLYPYPKDAETLPLPANLHFLYFPLRPFLWVWRKARKHA